MRPAPLRLLAGAALVAGARAAAELPDCSGLASPPSQIGEGALATEEWLAILGYVVSILLMLFGPAHIGGGLWRRCRGTEPPWFLGNTVYAPCCGLLYLAVVQEVVDVPRMVSGHLLWDVVKDKFDIVFLIQSFAYLSISLDVSNFFKLCAFKIVKAANGDGTRLFVGIYVLCSVLTFFTSNDIVIISMTPIIIYTAVYSKIKNVVPLLIAQFVAANTTSMGMYIGSPTNIVLGDAVQITFIDYLLWMFFPTVVAAAVTLFMLLLWFKWFPLNGVRIVERFKPLDEDIDVLLRRGFSDPPAAGAEDEAGAGAGAASSSSTVAAASSRNAGDEETEMVEVDVNGGGGGDDSSALHNGAELSDDTVARAAVSPEDGGPLDEDVELYVTEHMTSRRAMWNKVGIFSVCLVFLTISSFIGAELWYICLATATVMLAYDVYLTRLDKGSTAGFVVSVAHRMPWAIAPFVFAMFSMVQVLTNVGFTGRFANWMLVAAGGTEAGWLDEPGMVPTHDSGGSAFSISMVYGYVSAAMVNVLNDIPSTVFWANMVPIFCGSYNKVQYLTMVYALLVGNNPGCYLTLIGALAGLMWNNIISKQPAARDLITPGGKDLTKYGLLIILPVIFSSCLVVWAEVQIVHG